MTIVILCMSLLVFIIIVTIFYDVAKKSDNKTRRLNSIAGNYKNELDEELEKPFVQRFLFPIFMDTMKNLSRLLPKNKGNETRNTEKNLKLARINLTVNEYNAARLMFSGAFVLAAILITAFIPVDFAIRILIVVFSILISSIAPIYFVKFRISSRQEGIRNQLPLVMFIFPVLFIILLGPTVLQIMKQFGGK